MSEARDDTEIFWVDPKRRGILPLDGFHMSRSLGKRVKNATWRVSRNTDFAAVVSACADRNDTWISHKIATLYQGLHDLGYAHSLEVWDDTKLIGGVYGVATGAAFFGESMFSRCPDASKFALAYLVTHLNAQGFRLFDTQFLTDHLASLGAIEISRSTYHNKLHDALQLSARFMGGSLPTAQDVLHRKTHTS